MRGERAAVTALFFVSGATFSSFFARLPAIKSDLGASDGELGVALVFATAGLVLAQPLAGLIVVRRGGRAAAIGGAILCAAGLPFAPLAPSVAVLALVLFVVGLANGLLDVAMNAMGVAVQRRAARRMFASMHAAFSFGVMAGAGGGAIAALAGVSPVAHLAVVAGAVGLATGVAASGLPREVGDPRGPAFARPSRRLAALGAAAFCVLLAEGAVTDWSAVYLNDEAGASEGAAATGLTVFSLAMAVGRLRADALTERLGPATMVRAGGVLAAGGMGLVLATGAPWPGLAGLAAMGAGLAATFPLIVAAAARVDGRAEAPAIAAVSGAGYAGLMAGPAAIGLLSDVAGLRSALLLVVALCVLAAALGGTLRQTHTPPVKPVL